MELGINSKVINPYIYEKNKDILPLKPIKQDLDSCEISTYADNVMKAEEFILEGLSKGLEYGVALECKTGKLLGQATGSNDSVKMFKIPKNIKYISIHDHP